MEQQTLKNLADINTKLLGKVEVYYPDLKIQRKVVGILSAIDNKIELNQRINHKFVPVAYIRQKAYSFGCQGRTGTERHGDQDADK